MAGSIVAIFIAPEAGTPMQSVNEARLEEGQGIVGDVLLEGIRLCEPCAHLTIHCTSK